MQLLRWARALALVHELQHEFLDEIGDVLPGWLKRQRRQRKARRVVELDLLVLEVVPAAISYIRDQLRSFDV